jgi:hypothetical protein
LRQTTGSGGEHWIFRALDGVTVRQLAGFRPGLDTRVSGRGYLLVAPSVHPKTGKRYRWHSVMEPVEAPAWLLELVKAKSVDKTVYTPSVVTMSGEHDRCICRACERKRASGREDPHEGCICERCRRIRYGQAVLRGVTRKVAEAPEGHRNKLLFWAWLKAAEWRDVVPRATAERELTAAAVSCGLNETEIKKVLR